MDNVVGFVVIILVFVFFFLWDKNKKEARRQKLSAMSPDERAAYDAQRQKAAAQNRMAAARMAHGPLNSAMVCPHCQQQGGVRTKKIDRKRGISGGKATAALLTGGVSMLATGLSRKEHITRARCTKCGNGWDF